MRKLSDKVRGSVKFGRIAQSVAEVGVIEPLVVVRSPGEGPLMLLDGHVRLAILKDLGARETRCLIPLWRRDHAHQVRALTVGGV